MIGAEAKQDGVVVGCRRSERQLPGTEGLGASVFSGHPPFAAPGSPRRWGECPRERC